MNLISILAHAAHTSSGHTFSVKPTLRPIGSSMRHPRHVFTAGAIVLLVTILPFSLTAGASAASTSRTGAGACTDWKVTGTWHATQSNLASLTFKFVQHGVKLTGTSINPPSAAAELGYRTGSITGTVDGSHIDFVTHWERSSIDGVKNIGHYFGTISTNRMAGGANNLARDPDIQETWSAHGPALCTKHV